MKIKICSYKNKIFTFFYIKSLGRRFFSYGEFDFKKEITFLSTEFTNQKEVFEDVESELKVLKIIEIDSIEILFKSDLKFEILLCVESFRRKLISFVPFYGKISRNRIFVNNVKVIN